MRTILILGISLLLGHVITAQQINTVPSTLAKKIPDGWYKYDSEGVKLDVQITNGYIVKGNIKWFNNDTYSGGLYASEISGKGTYTWVNGERYEGSFRKNQRHGKGTMYWENGEKYSGKWKNDKPNGKGKIWKTDGTVVAGVWENGMKKK